MRGLEKRYFEYLTEMVCDDDAREEFSLLLEELYQREFIALLDRDLNRIADGLDLRARFATVIGKKIEDVEYVINEKCSILEVLVALADRCEHQIMEDWEYGDRTKEWFWAMIQNLRLDLYDNLSFDEEEINEKLDIFINREYDYCGNGALFYVKSPPEDMRKTEIWYQMQYWLIENFD